MKRTAYVAELLRFYLEAPSTPRHASHHDRWLAAELYRQGVPLEHLTHAIRLATLRRCQRRQAQLLEPVHSLAYYHTVLERLSEHELEADYVEYVRDAYQRLAITSKPQPRRQNAALARRR